MSAWRVTVSDPLNEAVLREFENGARVSDGEVALRGFDPPVVTPPGQSKNLNLYVKQVLAEIPPRAIIQFAVNDTPVFWGPAIITPPLAVPGAGPFDQDRDAIERVTVTGGEQLLRESIVGPRMFDTETDVAEIALELCELYAHPALTVDPGNFPTTGAVLSVYYAPEKDLLASLQELTETVPGGADTWVDATGAVHFRVREE